MSCNPHPDAPHGFCRNSSHSGGEYVCECHSWTPEDETLPTEEFNMSLPDLDDDGKIKPFIRPMSSDQALHDIGAGKVPDFVAGIEVDF